MVKYEVVSVQQLEEVWANHLKGEFESKDVEETLATMVDDASVNHMPVNTGGNGKDALRRFYSFVARRFGNVFHQPGYRRGTDSR